jgi:ABC-2 type transport system ATP-binding protein
MTVSSFLNFVCDVRRIERKKIAREIERVADICALSDVYHRSIDTLSKGYRKRVGLAQVLIGDPPVLLLDEPTDGLDPNQKRYVRSLIKSMSKNKAIVVSTHILEELEAICNRAIIINEGKIAADSTPDDFRERGKGSIDVFFENITEGRR